MDPFERRVRASLRGLELPSGPWLLGVSGGADSTALACALAAARPELALTLAHLDHGWRPAEAAADRGAVAALAERLGAAFVHGAVEPTAGAAGSLEAGARDARHAWLAARAAELDAAVIALGHQRDDQIETVLWRFVRGTQPTGLAGIPRVRRLPGGATLVRPLLDEPRTEVEAYLRRQGVVWRDDPSNRDPRFLRARLRSELLPLLRELNPRFPEAVERLAESARGFDAWVGREVAALGLDLGAPRLPLASLAELPQPLRERLVHDWLRPQVGPRLLAVHVHTVLRVAEAGGQAELPDGWRVHKAPGALELLGESPEETVAPPAVTLPCPGERELPAWGLRVCVRLHDEAPADPRELPPHVAYLDRAVVKGPLGLRGRRIGDRFWPLGSSGTRTLKRFYIDRRIPRSARNGLPVVTDDDRPVWVVGHRIDQRYRVTSATRSVLEIRTEISAGEMEEG